MRPRRPSSPSSERSSASGDTSAGPFGSTGTWTRRPSVVITTATARRSCRSKRPKLASRRSCHAAGAARWPQSSRVRPCVNVDPLVLALPATWQSRSAPSIGRAEPDGRDVVIGVAEAAHHHESGCRLALRGRDRAGRDHVCADGSWPAARHRRDRHAREERPRTDRCTVRCYRGLPRGARIVSPGPSGQHGPQASAEHVAPTADQCVEVDDVVRRMLRRHA